MKGTITPHRMTTAVTKATAPRPGNSVTPGTSLLATRTHPRSHVQLLGVST
jgi:hypothetical protein